MIVITNGVPGHTIAAGRKRLLQLGSQCLAIVDELKVEMLDLLVRSLISQDIQFQPGSACYKPFVENQINLLRSGNPGIGCRYRFDEGGVRLDE